MATTNCDFTGTILEAVTKDQLNTGLEGQIRYRVSERNLYAYLFGVKQPIVHVMGYFVSVLRERIASFEAPQRPGEADEVSVMAGISLNFGCPTTHRPSEAFLGQLQRLGKPHGALVRAFTSPIRAVRDVDVVYTDVWTSKIGRAL